MKLKYRSAAVRAAVILTLGFGIALPTTVSSTVVQAAEIPDVETTAAIEEDAVTPAGINSMSLNIESAAAVLLESAQSEDDADAEEEAEEETSDENAEAESTLLAFAASIDTSAQDSLAAAAAAADTAEDSQIGQVCVANVSNAVNVRAGAGADYDQVGLLYRGAAGVVLSVDGEWTQIASGDVTGWVKSEYLVTGEQAEALAASLTPQVATVTATELRVRSGAGTNTTVLSVIPTGTKLVVESVEGSWVKVKLTSETEGYVYADYVTLESGFAVAVSAAEEAELQSDVDERAAARTAAKSSSSTSSSSSSSSSSTSGWVYLGTYKITAYCGCSKCSSNGVTASGAVPTAGYTIAVNTSNISLGSTVKISGLGTYVAQDTGVGSNTIDIYMNSHSEALAWGVHYMDVYVQK